MDPVKTEGEPRKFTRRKVLTAIGAGTAVGILGGVLLPSKDHSQVSATSPTPSSTPRETLTPTPTAKPTESPSPSPSPEVKVGELPDVLSSTDKDWQKYFAKETDLGKINEMIRQQQTEENTKAQTEGREPKVVSLFIFNPEETAKLGDWKIRRLSVTNSPMYAFILPTGTQLKVPFEGGMDQRGFSGGGRSLDIQGKNGYLFWAIYFGNVEFNQKSGVTAGSSYLKTNDETQIFEKFGSVSMGGDTNVAVLVRKNAVSPSLSNLKWLTNEKNQLVFT